jgi:ABC-type branched-subunit amino acid transport system ATPase component
VSELRLAGVRAGYGTVPVLAGVDLAVGRGRTVALLGRNGAGKTTLLRTILGMTSISGGSVMLGDEELTGTAAHGMAGRGVQWVPEDRGVFATLTVEENLQLGMLAGAGRGDGAAARRDAVLDALPVIRERLSQSAGVLSGGERQQLAIARAVLACPAFLLLDEFSEGVQPSMVRHLMGLIRSPELFPGAPEIGVLLIDQDARFALEISDHIHVMEKGRIVDHGAAEEFRHDEARLTDRLAV